MERLPVAGGYVTITNEAVEADTSVPKAFYRLYKQSKIGFGTLVVAIVTSLLIGIFDPSFWVPIGLAALILVAYMLLALLINKVFRPNVTMEKVIPREAIQLIVYKEGRGSVGLALLSYIVKMGNGRLAMYSYSQVCWQRMNR